RLPAADERRRYHQSPAARRQYGIRALAGRNLHRTLAEGRVPASQGALDFETPNPHAGNACQVGLAWIERGRVVRIEERYIRPREMRFTFTWVHGITAAHVEAAPEFPDALA